MWLTPATKDVTSQNFKNKILVLFLISEDTVKFCRASVVQLIRLGYDHGPGRDLLLISLWRFLCLVENTHPPKTFHVNFCVLCVSNTGLHLFMQRLLICSLIVVKSWNACHFDYNQVSYCNRDSLSIQSSNLLLVLSDRDNGHLLLTKYCYKSLGTMTLILAK